MTAAMPMTTPRTVRPERSLFFPSVRSEMTSRSNRSTGLPRRGRVYPGHERLSFGQLALQHFRELVLDESERDGDGPQQRPVLHPNQALLAALGQLRFLACGFLRGSLLRAGWQGFDIMPILRPDLVRSWYKPQGRGRDS